MQIQHLSTKSKAKKYEMKFVDLDKNYKVHSAFDIDHISMLEDTGSSHAPSLNESKSKPSPKRQKKIAKTKPMNISLSSAVIRTQKAVNKRHKEIRITHLQNNDIEEEFHCKNEYEHKDSCFEWMNNFYKQTIMDIIFNYAEKGDVQSSALMLLVFKSKIPFPTQRISSVLRLYISLLNRIGCTCLATEVIKFCQIADIQNEYEKNTGISTKCQYCKNKESGKDIKCYLDKWGKFNSHCSIWDIPVRGRFWWCQHWGHGGHAHHMKKWFSHSNEWPTGCGHQWLDENAYQKVFF